MVVGVVEVEYWSTERVLSITVAREKVMVEVGRDVITPVAMDRRELF